MTQVNVEVMCSLRPRPPPPPARTPEFSQNKRRCRAQSGEYYTATLNMKLSTPPPQACTLNQSERNTQHQVHSMPSFSCNRKNIAENDTHTATRSRYLHQIIYPTTNTARSGSIVIDNGKCSTREEIISRPQRCNVIPRHDRNHCKNKRRNDREESSKTLFLGQHEYAHHLTVAG